MFKSILQSGLRSFVVALCAVLGLIVGAVLIDSIFTGSAKNKLDVEDAYKPTIVANGEDKRTALSATSPVILMVPVEGFIGSDSLNTDAVRQQLIESRENLLKGGRVKAVLLNINSPGGTVGDADGIYRAIKSYKERYKVPVYAYVDGLCASGGMYIAASADRIYASDSSIIGSIGVLLNPIFNLTKLMEKIGVESLTLSAGKGKDELNPFRQWKPGEDESYKAIIDYYYNYFVDIIVSNRPEMSKARLISDYGARVYPADKAHEYGYIDAAGYSLGETITELAKQIGIHDDYYQVVKMDKKGFSLSSLFDTGAMMMSGKIKHQLELPVQFDPKFMSQFLYLYVPGK